jgi:hypothetical protein
MKNLALLIFITGFLVVGESIAQTPFTVIRLADVRTVYVDEKSFRFTYSSCGTKVGGMMLPCPKHALEREEFLIVLKRWIGKSGFTLVDNKKDADGIVQGSLFINDLATPVTKHNHDDKDKKSSKHRPTHQTEWVVDAWIVNQDGDKLWIKGAGYPGISYGVSSKAKVEGKTLAKSIEHDYKKGH